ncbi:S1 family peptidase [Streptosporangium sp. NPDC001559]|uniref:S1 family peptidase n=1 Tax=Streptosporangium sp. NPDC001559 TaxID=3366187 RepID=UPI0036F063AD
MRSPSPRLFSRALATVLAAIVSGYALPASAASSTPQTAARLPELTALKMQLDRLAEQGKAGNAQYWYVNAAEGRVRIAVLKGPLDVTTKSFLATGPLDLTSTFTVDKPVRPYVATATAPLRPPMTGSTALAETVYGGQQIVTQSGVYCTTGFNVTRNGQSSVLTAGHCRKAGITWGLDGWLLGRITAFTYPGGDVSYITPATGWQQPSAVRQADGSIQSITQFGRPSINQTLCKTGATTGTTCGTVISLDVTTNYGDGPVYGLALTTVHAAEGDSGGSVYEGSTGVALISGGPEGGGNALVYPLP